MKNTLLFLSLFVSMTLCGGCGQQASISYTSPDSLGEARIGVAMGSVHDTYVSEHYLDADIHRSETMVELPLLLRGGRVDFILLDENVARSMLLQYPDLEVVEDRLFVSDIAAGFSYENPKLCNEFNDFITRFKSTNTYADIVRRWHEVGDGGVIPHIDEVVGGPKVRVGLSSLIPPFCIVRDNKLEGSSVEIAKHFALEYGYTLDLMDMNITGLLSSIQTNRVDLLIPGLIYTKERAESILFSNTYLHSASKVIALKSEADSGAKESEAAGFVYSDSMLNDSRIVVLTGSTADIYTSTNYPNAEVVRVDNMSDFYPMLNNGQADFIIADLSQMEELRGIYPDFVIGNEELYANGVAAMLPKGNEALRDELNEFLRRFTASPQYEELYDQWIVRGDITNIPEVESVKSNRKIRVATDLNNFPYNTIVDGRITGLEIEMIRHFALDRGIEVEFINMNFAALINAVASSKVDMAVCLISSTEERKKNFLFTDDYTAIASGVGYLDRQQNPKESHSAEGRAYKPFKHPEIVSSREGVLPSIDDTMRCYIGNRPIAAVEGTVQEQYISSTFDASQVLIVKDYADGLLSMIGGAADFMLTNIGTGKSFSRAQESVEIVLDDIFAYTIHYAVSKSNGSLKQEVNAFLERLRADGTLDKLNKKWFDGLEDAVFEEVEYAPNAPVLRVGSGCTSIPFTFISNGRHVGLDIEILALFCVDAGYKLEVVELPFGALISALASGRVDLLANTLSTSPERCEKVDFTDPYGRSCFALIHTRELIEGSSAAQSGGESRGLFGSIKDSFVRNVITESRYKMIIDGVWVTLIISLLSIIFGTLMGAIVCSMTMNSSRVIRWFGELYVTIVRGTPVLVILMLNFYVIFAKLPLSPVWVATISFAMNFGAYVSEMFRSSIISIDRGQREAGLAMGFSNVKTFIFIIAPQAIRRVMPVYKGEAISLVKMTSIVGYIAVQDITKVGDIIRSRTFDAFFPLLVSALLYFLIAYIFSVLLDLLTSKITRQR